MPNTWTFRYVPR